MARHLFTFPCPCCDKLVEVDTRTGKARAIRPDEKKQGGDLDSLLSAQRQESQRLDSLFDSARSRESNDADILAQQLARAKEEAKKDKDERPPNIFDLD
ncbi:MAG: hypothetical protein KDC98_17990 [Planctomycetes bacterium]|nr:hypothetical protein [Planctomycetota bacterium]